MRILGIDPGIGRTGYAVIESDARNTKLLECGCITTNTGTEEYKRLLEIRNDIDEIIKKHKPDALCIESLFFANNAKTVMSVGQARGVIVVTAAEHDLKLIEVTPLQVKISATGYGKADKAQVLKMIMTLLKLKKAPTPDDAADACAVAWSGISRYNLENLTKRP